MNGKNLLGGLFVVACLGAAQEAQASACRSMIITASFYDTSFHGQETSTGETFRLYGNTVAHRTLPLNAKVTIRDLVTNKQVSVRVNDRPNKRFGSRRIDLSWAVAQRLSEDVVCNTSKNRQSKIKKGTENDIVLKGRAYSGNLFSDGLHPVKVTYCR